MIALRLVYESQPMQDKKSLLADGWHSMAVLMAHVNEVSKCGYCFFNSNY